MNVERNTWKVSCRYDKMCGIDRLRITTISSWVAMMPPLILMVWIETTQ